MQKKYPLRSIGNMYLKFKYCHVYQRPRESTGLTFLGGKVFTIKINYVKF